mmetsp:Transcript_25896/g.59794  ORF Transcript_25896/g.59794 Transcript_25896/m.59794 type:complete len:213 (+) Transcript_25896:319-957(+)
MAIVEERVLLLLNPESGLHKVVQAFMRTRLMGVDFPHRAQWRPAPLDLQEVLVLRNCSLVRVTYDAEVGIGMLVDEGVCQHFRGRMVPHAVRMQQLLSSHMDTPLVSMFQAHSLDGVASILWDVQEDQVGLPLNLISFFECRAGLQAHGAQLKAHAGINRASFLVQPILAKMALAQASRVGAISAPSLPHLVGRVPTPLEENFAVCHIQPIC